jgi:hypothetical protein
MDFHHADGNTCHVLYVNRSIGQDRTVRGIPTLNAGDSTDDDDSIRSDIRPLLEAFGDGESLSCISWGKCPCRAGLIIL